MERITYRVDAEEGWRVDYLMKKKFLVGSGMIASLKRVENGITLNGCPVHTDVRVKKGDELSFSIEDTGGRNPAPPVDIPLNIVYEDDYLVVVDKPAGIAVQGPPEIGDRTIAGAFSFLWGQEKSFHPPDTYTVDLHSVSIHFSGILEYLPPEQIVQFWVL